MEVSNRKRFDHIHLFLYGAFCGRRICPLRPVNVPQTSRKSDFGGPILNVSVFNAFSGLILEMLVAQLVGGLLGRT